MTLKKTPKLVLVDMGWMPFADPSTTSRKHQETAMAIRSVVYISQNSFSYLNLSFNHVYEYKSNATKYYIFLPCLDTEGRIHRAA